MSLTKEKHSQNSENTKANKFEQVVFLRAQIEKYTEIKNKILRVKNKKELKVLDIKIRKE